MVQTDLNKIDWMRRGQDNISSEERCAIRELKEAKHLVNKHSDKGGNVILLDEKMY